MAARDARMQRILIVEDESALRSTLRRLLKRNGYEVSEAGSVAEAESRHTLSGFDLIISDLRLPGAPGTDLIGKAGAVPVLIMTSHASLRSAVNSIRKGAADYIAMPGDHDGLVNAARRIIEARAKRLGRNGAGDGRHGGFVCRCPDMRALYRHIEKVAPTDVTVLVLGETGTGKELVARSVHQRSGRRQRALVSVNCAAFPETLIESELFGHEKGALAGANASRAGLIEAADGGTLFLDEIGELPMEAQARLLRFIQEGEIRRIGAADSRKVDARLICATHRDLRRLADEGEFRQDLFHRINVLRLRLPPLRERGGDIPELAEFLLRQRAAALGRGARRFTPDAMRAIRAYAWPGNVRELENAVERAVILGDGEEVDLGLLGIDAPLAPAGAVSCIHGGGRVGNYDPPEDLSLEDYFQRFVLEHQDSMSETELAQKLGVSRKCLWERRQRFGIPRKRGAGARNKKNA